MVASLPGRTKIDDSGSTVEPSDSEQIKVDPSDSSDEEDKANWPLDERRTEYRSMTKEEYMQYLKEAINSKGFDVSSYEGGVPGGVVPILTINEEKRKLLSSLSKEALHLYNTKEDSAFRFVEIVKVNEQAVAGRMFYITFKAKEGDDEDSQTFRAKVWRKICKQGIEVQFCEKV